MDTLPSCPWTSLGECATARERSVAGTSNPIPPCYVHHYTPEHKHSDECTISRGCKE